MRIKHIAGAWLLSLTIAAAQAAEAPAANMDPALRTATTRAVDRGLHYLREHQSEDGSYSASVGITGLALRAFLESHRAYDESDGAFITRSVDFLLKNVQPDGAISQTPQNRSYNTSLALGAIAATKNEKYRSVLSNGQSFLKKHQIDEGEGYDPTHRFYGGIGYGGDERPDMANQFIALDALRATSLDPKDPTWKKALIFISRSQNRSESNDQKFAANDGGFIYMPGANTAPYKGTDSYGGITAAGLISLLYSGADKNDPRVVAAYNWIKKNYTLETNPGTGLKDGIFYYYYAYAQAMAAMGDAEVIDGNGQKHNWRNELATKLLALQSADGSWVNKDSSRFMQDNANLVSGWAVNALNFTLR
jgi:squalene-hopene/tetraprenyl-beta-curcumene cyclase